MFVRIANQADKHKGKKQRGEEIKGAVLIAGNAVISYRNGWVDDQNRVFIIFTVEEVMETLRCRSEKAVRLFAELDSKKGIGLIERKRQGLGKPAIIYVKNFAGDIS